MRALGTKCGRANTWRGDALADQVLRARDEVVEAVLLFQQRATRVPASGVRVSTEQRLQAQARRRRDTTRKEGPTSPLRTPRRHECCGNHAQVAVQKTTIKQTNKQQKDASYNKNVAPGNQRSEPNST